jgi:hypothetical protein
VAGGGSRERRRGRQAVEHGALDVVDEHGVAGHQHAGADDLRLLAADPLSERLELLCRGAQRGVRALDLGRTPLVRHGLVGDRRAAEQARAADRQAR